MSLLLKDPWIRRKLFSDFSLDQIWNTLKRHFCNLIKLWYPPNENRSQHFHFLVAKRAWVNWFFFFNENLRHKGGSNEASLNMRWPLKWTALLIVWPKNWLCYCLHLFLVWRCGCWSCSAPWWMLTAWLQTESQKRQPHNHGSEQETTHLSESQLQALIYIFLNATEKQSINMPMFSKISVFGVIMNIDTMVRI